MLEELQKNKLRIKIRDETPLVSRKTILLSEYKNILLGVCEATPKVSKMVDKSSDGFEI